MSRELWYNHVSLNADHVVVKCRYLVHLIHGSHITVFKHPWSHVIVDKHVSGSHDIQGILNTPEVMMPSFTTSNMSQLCNSPEVMLLLSNCKHPFSHDTYI